MTSFRARAPSGESQPAPIDDPDVIAGYLEDAAHVPGGHATRLFRPSSEAEVAAILAASEAVLPVGAQSSLTGGATPMGESLVSMARFRTITRVRDDCFRVGAGVTLDELDQNLSTLGLYYPPSPTFTGAFVGGTVATNAAGAATFKYGTTRDWVRGLTVVLPGGDVLDLERGRTHATAGVFDLALQRGAVRVPVPTYRMPDVPKLSAGYFARPTMDLIDLFIGSEGTLGIITEATVAVVPRPAFCLAFITFNDRARALAFIARLREAATLTWISQDPDGVDISAIEHMDRRCLELLREDGIDRRCHVDLPADAEMAFLVTLDLPAGTTRDQAYEEIGRAAAGARDTALVRFCTLLSEFDALDRTTIAAPGDRARAAELLNIREAVPAAVNQRVGHAQRTVDSRIQKTAADMIVPFEQFERLLAYYDAELSRRGLDAAIWGHISDGNVHPNVIPRSFADVEAGREAVLAFGDEVIRLGGAPLAEHGVGRNPTKQALLQKLYGPGGIEEMRRVKEALDPGWKLSPGVIFPRARRP